LHPVRPTNCTLTLQVRMPSWGTVCPWVFMNEDYGGPHHQCV
jgi:hypothetical protein